MDKIIYISDRLLVYLITLLVIINIFLNKNAFFIQLKDIVVNLIVPLVILRFYAFIKNIWVKTSPR